VSERRQLLQVQLRHGGQRVGVLLGLVRLGLLQNVSGERPPWPATGSVRAIRGGGWSHLAMYFRVALRSCNGPESKSAALGFGPCLLLGSTAGSAAPNRSVRGRGTTLPAIALPNSFPSSMPDQDGDVAWMATRVCVSPVPVRIAVHLTGRGRTRSTRSPCVSPLSRGEASRFTTLPICRPCRARASMNVTPG
jgi:hypothetical protein